METKGCRRDAWASTRAAKLPSPRSVLAGRAALHLWQSRLDAKLRSKPQAVHSHCGPALPLALDLDLDRFPPALPSASCWGRGVRQFQVVHFRLDASHFTLQLGHVHPSIPTRQRAGSWLP